MADRESNECLKRLHAEADWSLRQFAHLVNRVGTEQGHTTRYQPPSVHQWIHGQMPRAATRPLILEALSRRLGRPITAMQAGFPPPPDGGPPPGTVEGLIDLGSADMDPSRRGVMGAALFSVALTVPDWQDVVGRMEAVQSGKTPRMGMGEVDMVTAMTERLSDLDDQFGGRHARPMAAAFLVNTVSPYLRTDAKDEVRKAMMSAASDLCYLTGYMAVDEGIHGLGQRYYTKALELAGAAEDHLTYCTTLRGMSVQSVDLGHGPIAVRLGDAAASASPQAGPRMRAFLAGQQAHAYAQVGDRPNAMRFLKDAEMAMEKAESREKTFGSYDPAALAYHTAQVRYELGDTKGSIASLTASNRLRPSKFRRGQVRHLALLAERQLEMGNLELACETWGSSLDLYPGVQSGRCDARMVEMRKRIRPYLGNRYAKALHERARSTLPM
ncbi:tetratricopeptide repeat protein [Streptomyces sp. NPDC000594]|uniref:tetratricopeptide repeat protein n=1 Tax=Streptomyces sp. NPDC000594 TaxID=3154261 RepID=UPI003325E82C